MPNTREKGFFVGFDYSSDAMTEIDGFFRRQHIAIVPLTVRGHPGRTNRKKAGCPTLVA